MSATQYLNELETERQEIERSAAGLRTPRERADWWDRLADWWHRRDLGFGDGSGMKAHCRNKARRIREENGLSLLQCDDCGARNWGRAGDRCPEMGPKPENGKHCGYLDPIEA